MNEILDNVKNLSFISANRYGQVENKYSKYVEGSVCLMKYDHCFIFYLLEKQQKEVKIGKTSIYSTEFIPRIYKVSPNNYDETTDHANALNIMNRFKKLFKNKYKKTIKSVFGECIETKSCIPSPINYGKTSIQMYSEVFKADISSAYGYELSKVLPTSIDMQRLCGFHEPTNEYPFAFYPAEKKLSVQGEEITSGLTEAEYTILMKAAPFKLNELINDIYNKKEHSTTKQEKQEYKDLLNIPIGYFQKNSNPAQSFITAVVIARCNARMKKLCSIIESNPYNEVILINTDSIAWSGVDIPEIYTTEKKLGNFIIEHKNIKAYIKGAKSYQLLDGNKVKTVYAGIKKEKQENMKFGDIFNQKLIAEAYDWDEDSKRFVIFEINNFNMIIRRK